MQLLMKQMKKPKLKMHCFSLFRLVLNKASFISTIHLKHKYFGILYINRLSLFLGSPPHITLERLILKVLFTTWFLRRPVSKKLT